MPRASAVWSRSNDFAYVNRISTKEPAALHEESKSALSQGVTPTRQVGDPRLIRSVLSGEGAVNGLRDRTMTHLRSIQFCNTVQEPRYWILKKSPPPPAASHFSKKYFAGKRGGPLTPSRYSRDASHVMLALTADIQLEFFLVLELEGCVVNISVD